MMSDSLELEPEYEEYVADRLFKNENYTCLMLLYGAVHGALAGNEGERAVDPDDIESLREKWEESHDSAEGIDWESVWRKVVVKAAQSFIGTVVGANS